MKRLLLLLAVTGCTETLPDRALVDDLRVLAVRAEPAEAMPGDTVEIDALVADPRGGGRPIRRAWAMCTPGPGGVGSCGNPANVMALGTDLRATWTVPDDILDDIAEEDRALGKDVYVVFGVEADDELQPHEVAFKRLRISTSTERNANPEIGAFLLDGSSSPDPLVVRAGADVSLDVLADPGSIEEWSGGVEDTRFTWLVSIGGVAEAISFGDASGFSSNTWKTPVELHDQPDAWVWVVLRDGRGGITWAVQPVTFE